MTEHDGGSDFVLFGSSCCWTDEYNPDWTTADEQVLTTSSMMGSGFAASSWSLSLSSTANKLVTISQQRATAKEKSGSGGAPGGFSSVRRWLMIEEMFTCGRFGIGDFPLLQLFVLRGIVSQLQLSGDAEKHNGGINHKGYDLTACQQLFLLFSELLQLSRRWQSRRSYTQKH